MVLAPSGRLAPGPKLCGMARMPAGVRIPASATGGAPPLSTPGRAGSPGGRQPRLRSGGSAPSEKLSGRHPPPLPTRAHSLVLGRQVVEDIGDGDGREGQHEDPGGRRGAHCRRPPRRSPFTASRGALRPVFRQRPRRGPEPSGCR